MLKLQYGNAVMSVAHGTAVKEIVPDDERLRIYGIVLNGKLHELNYRIKEEGTLRFIYADSDDGKLIYERSLRFLFIAAVKSLCEKARIHVRYSFPTVCIVKSPIRMSRCIAMRSIKRCAGS